MPQPIGCSPLDKAAAPIVRNGKTAVCSRIEGVPSHKETIDVDVSQSVGGRSIGKSIPPIRRDGEAPLGSHVDSIATGIYLPNRIVPQPVSGRPGCEGVAAIR